MSGKRTGKRRRVQLLPILALGIILTLPGVSLAAKTVGMIMPRDCAAGADAKDKFVEMLMKSGLARGEAEVFVQRPAPDKVSRLNSARKFLSFGVDAIVIWGGTAVDEILRESGKVPVVFIGVYDPVKQGIVKDLKSPGKNTTGVASTTSMSFLLDNIMEASGERLLGVIYHSGVSDSRVQLEELKALSVKKGLKLILLDASKQGMAQAAQVLAPAPFLYQAQGCYVEGDRFVNLEKLGKPAATQTPGVTSGGIVFTLAPDPDKMLKEAAGITARVFKGEKAKNIPVVRMKDIDFIINMSEARRMGVKIPFPVLNRATKIIK